MWRVVLLGIVARVFVELTARTKAAIEERGRAGTHDGGIFYENSVTCYAELVPLIGRPLLYVEFPARLDLDCRVSRPITAKGLRSIVEGAVEQVVSDRDIEDGY